MKLSCNSEKRYERVGNTSEEYLSKNGHVSKLENCKDTLPPTDTHIPQKFQNLSSNCKKGTAVWRAGAPDTGWAQVLNTGAHLQFQGFLTTTDTCLPSDPPWDEPQLCLPGRITWISNQRGGTVAVWLNTLQALTTEMRAEQVLPGIYWPRKVSSRRSGGCLSQCLQTTCLWKKVLKKAQCLPKISFRSSQWFRGKSRHCLQTGGVFFFHFKYQARPPEM